MGKHRRKKRYVPPSVAVRMQQKQPTPSAARTWWWVGGAVAVVILLTMILWFAVGPGKPTPPEPTAAAVTEPTATLESGGSNTMPANAADRNNMYSAPPPLQIDPDRVYTATIATARGDIVVRLDAAAAPQTVNNFVFLARQGFYDGLTFHRVEPGFVIQGGDPLGNGAGGPGYTVPAEIGLLHDEGVIAMARRADSVNPTRASSGSQFYITLAPTPHLDGGYTVFGRVVEGMDVVQSIAVGDVIEAVAIVEGD